jgi:hypothetical protein
MTKRVTTVTLVGGRYDDEYVKTPQGWKFKVRTFTPSRVDVRPDR